MFTKIGDCLSTYSGLVIGRPGAVLLQYHHVPLVALDLVQGLLGLGMALPRPTSLQVTVLLPDWSTLIGRAPTLLHSHWSRASLVLLAPAARDWGYFAFQNP